MSQHPYSASVSASEKQDLQQSLFPSWHNRRHSHTTDMILEEGRRKSGSFEALQDMVQKHQSKENDEQQDDTPAPSVETNKKFAPKGPSIMVHEPTNDTNDTSEKKPKVRRSVKFNAKEDDGSNFIKN